MPVLKIKNNDVWETISGASSNHHTHSVNDIIDFPSVTEDDNGKFMVVIDGKWAAETVPNAEEANF